MQFPELCYRWEWRLRSSPEQLWPYVSDTNRFNRDTGLPTLRSSGGALPNARRRLGYSRFGVPFDWDEEPFEWERPRRFGVLRRYRRGPLEYLRVEVELQPLSAGGTRLVYTSWLRPRGPIGLLGAPFAMGIVTRRDFGAAFQRYDRLASQPPSFELSPSPQLAPGGEARLMAARDRLVGEGCSPEDVDRLAELIARGDPLALAHLRPYAVADVWGAPRRQVLELCLHATRSGLLDLQWDLVCPLCRGAKASASALAELRDSAHCATCNIDVTTDLERAVELTFRPTARVRPVEAASYCVAGPGVTPHVVVQQLLAPKARRLVRVALEPGRYRARALGIPGGQFVAATEGGASEVEIAASRQGWPSGEAAVGLLTTLALANATDSEQLLVLERTEWSDQAATVAEVTTLQTFRDLFSRELVRAGEHISVGSLAILFTDLRDSTAMYRRVGDASAFCRVLDHFAVLREEVDREGGAIVKNIGDAIMAAFPRPRPALEAILRAQRRLAAPVGEAPLLGLKAGIHCGPCIAVTLNDRLDYFGTTVNLAARLERFSQGDDVIVSDAARRDPEVEDLLADAAKGLSASEFAAEVKGFDQETFRLWRIVPIDGAP